ncbi:hypothetical protein AOXY_G33536 [Acipenser oxyrinchus oxyrinchus]|uniref:Uncharacterized protein n=1 Tax=Acipenser oxyrinchus oxyrinchus TaxID=40147 RepID=A0AAD8CIP5_ACIOX|nr:hypothetical protein AOXY_G33536 [Acipenser oxyrinchus oxyrinchus]
MHTLNTSMESPESILLNKGSQYFELQSIKFNVGHQVFGSQSCQFNTEDFQLKSIPRSKNNDCQSKPSCLSSVPQKPWQL